MNRLLTLLLSSIPSLCASCIISAPAEWSPAEVPLCSPQRLWEISRMAMERDGLVVLNQSFDPRTRTLVSAWDKELHPFKGHGYRERAHVRYEAGTEPGMLLLSVRVEREINENLAKPLDPQYAKWTEGPDNPERARILLQYMHSLLGSELNLGKRAKEQAEKEKEYGKWE